MARFKWRLHHGIHIQNDAKGVERMYRQGDVFESDLELANLNGDITMSPKFERLEEVKVTLGERMPDSRGTVDERMQEVKRRGDEKSEVQKAAEKGFYSGDTPYVDPTHTAVGVPPTHSLEKEHKDSVSQGVKGHTPAKNLQEYSALLDKMNVEDLRAHAAEEEVDLKNATSKDQIIRVLRTSAKG